MAFVLLGHVFTSAMTGNTALLGVALGLGDGAAALRSACALVGFVFGAFAGTWISRGRRGRLQPLLLTEAMLVGAFALAWPWLGASRGGGLYTLIFLSACAMGVQGITAREANRFRISTLVFTNALLRITEAAARTLLGEPLPREQRLHALRDAWSYAAYAAGAALTALLLSREARWAVWAPFLAVAVAAIGYRRPALEPEKRREQGGEREERHAAVD